jgi:hypothetical protein
MLSSLFGLSSEVIQIIKDDVRKIMENIGHGSFKHRTHVLESKRHDMIIKGTPRGSKRGFVLICWGNLNLVIDREIIHKGNLTHPWWGVKISFFLSNQILHLGSLSHSSRPDLSIHGLHAQNRDKSWQIYLSQVPQVFIGRGC